MSETLSHIYEYGDKTLSHGLHMHHRPLEYRFKEQTKPAPRYWHWKVVKSYRSPLCRRGSQPTSLILRKQIVSGKCSQLEKKQTQTRNHRVEQKIETYDGERKNPPSAGTGFSGCFGYTALAGAVELPRSDLSSPLDFHGLRGKCLDSQGLPEFLTKTTSWNACRKDSYPEQEPSPDSTHLFVKQNDSVYGETMEDDTWTQRTTWATTHDGSGLGMGIFYPDLAPSADNFVPEIREYLVKLDSAAEAFQLGSSTVQKIVGEILPQSSGVAFGKDARDLLIECCVEFITLISSEANEISEKEAKKTIACEHITKALEQLGFGEYVADILAVASEHKELLKGREKRTNKLESNNMTTEEMLRLQEAEFREAAERHR